MKKEILPVTILKAVIKTKVADQKSERFIKVEKLQTCKVIPYGFYKPISKILGDE